MPHAYYITDRRQLGAADDEQCRRLLDKIAEAARAGVDLIQLREKDLTGRALLELSRRALQAVRENSATTKLLVNARVDVAIAAGLDGVHLTTTDMPADNARAVFAAAGRTAIIAASCHTVDELRAAGDQGADLCVYGPVFEKVIPGGKIAGIGLDALREGCAAVSTPVYALGGVTPENMRACLEAGAAGVAGIRLFQEADIATIVASCQ